MIKLFSANSKKSMSNAPSGDGFQSLVGGLSSGDDGSPVSYRGKRIGVDKIIKEGFETNSVLYSVILKLINKAGEIPLRAYKIRTQGGDRELIEDGFVWDLIHSPNTEQDQEEFLREVVGFYALTGNAVIEKIFAVGFDAPVGLKVIPTQLVTLSPNLKKYTIKDPVTDKERTISKDRIIHVKNFSPSTESITSGIGQSPIQAGFMTVDSGNDLKEANQHILKNQSISGIISNDSENMSLRPERAKELERISRKKFGKPSRIAQILFTGAKIKFTPFNTKEDSLKIFEREVAILRDICALYGLDSSIFNDPENKKFSNLREAEKSLYINGVTPILRSVCRAIQNDIKKHNYEGDFVSYEIEPDLSGVESLQANKKEESEKTKVRVATLTDLLTSNLSRVQKMLILKEEFQFSDQKIEELFSDVETE